MALFAVWVLLYCVSFSGITSETIKLPATITEDELIAKIQALNEDSDIDGILVQLPVPQHISERNVCNAVDPRKDVDGFHMTNVGRLTINMDTFVPCTALGVIELIKRLERKMSSMLYFLIFFTYI